MPYWNQYVVGVPFALTVPETDAERLPIPKARPVVTVGADAALVVKVWSAPWVVPAAFWATSR